MNKNIVTGGILLVVCAGAFLIAYTYFKQTSLPSAPPILDAPAPTVTSKQNRPNVIPSHSREAYIYTLSNGEDKDDTGLSAQKVELTDSNEPARDALQALIAAKHSPLPDKTQLRGIKIDGTKLATVDFSSEFKNNFHGSDSQEAQTINSILRTLGQFSSISQVQILVDGKTIDSLGEHFEISTPLDVIRPNAKQPNADSEAGQ